MEYIMVLRKIARQLDLIIRHIQIIIETVNGHRKLFVNDNGFITNKKTRNK